MDQSRVDSSRMSPVEIDVLELLESEGAGRTGMNNWAVIGALCFI